MHSHIGHRGLDELSQPETLPSGCSHKASSRNSLPSHVASSQSSCLLTLPVVFIKQAYSSNFLWSFCSFSLVLVFFLPSPKGTRIDIYIVALTSALATVTQVPLSPWSLRKLTRAMEGKEEILIEMERQSSLQIAFYWERFHCYKLPWEADLVLLHFSQQANRPTVFAIFLQGNVFLLPNYPESALF